MLYCSYVKMHKGALTMKIKYLLMGTSLSLIPTIAFAQCVATQDCATLGYTETSCSGGSGVKCPFGNKWACFKSESEICNDLGFTLACTGTNQTGGGGKDCNGKYNFCSCSDGFTWNTTSLKCEYDYKTNCVIGALYYSDGTCSLDKLSSKTVLGVVIYEKSVSQNGWIIAIEPILNVLMWGNYLDISEIANCTSVSCLTDVQASCTNTDIITAYGNSSKYPAAWAAKNYKPTATPTGKSWCLPSGGLLNNINNSTNFAKVNAGIATAGGTVLGRVSAQRDTFHEWVSSSSEYSSGEVWLFSATMNGYFSMDYYNKGNQAIINDNYTTVRPVLAF